MQGCMKRLVWPLILVCSHHPRRGRRPQTRLRSQTSLLIQPCIAPRCYFHPPHHRCLHITQHSLLSLSSVCYLVTVHWVTGGGLLCRSLAASATLDGSGISCGFRITNLDSGCRRVAIQQENIQIQTFVVVLSVA